MTLSERIEVRTIVKSKKQPNWGEISRMERLAEIDQEMERSMKMIVARNQ